MGVAGKIFGLADYVIGLVFDFPYFDVYFIGRPFSIFSALACGALRFMSGEFVAAGIDKCRRPSETLQLYEFEACPFCRKVREALNVLDLDALIKPCPKQREGAFMGSIEGSRFRGDVALPDGTTRFPVLKDGKNTIRGSEEIVDYLWREYGSDATAPLNYRLGRKADGFMPLFMLPMLIRLRSSCGLYATPSRQPQKPLALYGYEPSPFVKVVREALCCLELPYLLISMPHGSVAKRQTFIEKFGGEMQQGAARRAAGVIQVPLLVDPNTGRSLFESAAIVRYLYDTYGLVSADDTKQS